MLQNIASMVVTFSVCHSPMGWLNDFASENIYSMLTTLRTSQSPIGSLNSLNCSSLNNSLISVILDTSHEFGGPHWTSVSSWFVSHPTNILCNTNLDWGCTLVIPSARHSKGLFQKIPPRLNEPLPRIFPWSNILNMVVTFSVRHSAMGWLNDFA